MFRPTLSTKACVFCITEGSIGSAGVSPDRIIKEYGHWWLILNQIRPRQVTRQAAGMLVAKQHHQFVSDVGPQASQELIGGIKIAAAALCRVVGTRYTGQEIVGFNQGEDAGQSIPHAHVHIFPVSAEDPEVLNGAGGVGSAIQALYEQARANQG